MRCAWSKTWWNPLATRNGHPRAWAEVERWEGVNLELVPSEWCAIIGDNGLGKSTLLHGIAGSCPFVDGTIQVLGEKLRARDLEQRVTLGVYLVSQEPKCRACWSYDDIVAMATAARPGQKFGQAIESLRMALHERGIHRSSRAFSPREARTLIAVLTSPSVLLLDEAAESLSNSNIHRDDGSGSPLLPRDFYALIKALLPLTTILFVDHNHSVVSEFAEKVIKGSLGTVKGTNIYKFEVMATKDLNPTARHQAGEAGVLSSAWPCIDLQQSVAEHVALAIRATLLPQRATALSLADRARSHWPFLLLRKRADELSGGQKVILQCVMDIIETGHADLRHNRINHVFESNVRRLEALMLEVSDPLRP